MADNPFEIPQTMRDVTEQNMKQAHAAYEQLMAFVTKVMDPWTGAMPANPMAAVFKDVQGRAMRKSRWKNANSVFTLCRKDRQGTKFPRGFDTSGPFCSRPDAGLCHADAGASKADRGSSPEGATRLSFLMKEQHHRNKREPDLFAPQAAAPSPSPPPNCY